MSPGAGFPSLSHLVVPDASAGLYMKTPSRPTGEAWCFINRLLFEDILQRSWYATGDFICIGYTLHFRTGDIRGLGNTVK